MKKLSTFKNSLKSYFLNLKSSFGFTLIELIVVLSVVAVISVMGIAAFVSYNQTQSLNTAAADIASMFTVAKSRANSQVKPTSCSSQTLEGYQIFIVPATKSYELRAICSSGIYSILIKTLPSNITFDPASSTTFTFPVLTGGFTGAGTIVLSGFNKTKSITVDSSGNLR